MSHLQQRLLFSIIAGIIVIFAIYFSQSSIFFIGFLALLVGTVSCALWEYYHIAKLKGLVPAAYLGIIGSIVYLTSLFFSTRLHIFPILPEAILLTWFLLIFLYFFTSDSKPFVNLAITLFGFVYITFPLGFLVNITYFPFYHLDQDGRWWFIYLVAVTKMTDIGGYIIGRKMGKRKLAPMISPKKTIEGAIGGILFALATSITAWALSQSFSTSSPFQITLWQSIWLGVLIGAIAQLGDLSESLLKRDGGIKDSNKLPGVGGILDVVDSAIFTTPLLYLFMKATQ